MTKVSSASALDVALDIARVDVARVVVGAGGGVDVVVSVAVAVGAMGAVGVDVAVAVGAVGVDVAVANIASSGETVHTVGDVTVVGLAVAVSVEDGLPAAVDGLAGGLCHGGFQNTGSRGVPR